MYAYELFQLTVMICFVIITQTLNDLTLIGKTATEASI